MEKFWAAVVAAMQADTGAGSLVALTEHTSADWRLFSGKAVGDPKYPCISARGLPTVPAVTDSQTVVKTTPVMFDCIAKTRLLATQIADRLQVLLDQKSAAENVSYWSITTTDVRNKWTKFVSREDTDHDDETDTWTVTVTANFEWFLRT